MLQRDQPVPIWGWTTPGAKVTVKLNKKSATATAAADGRWQVKLAQFHAGGPYTITVTGPQTLVVNDVLLGDVWLCSGQSNMEMGLAACNATNEMAKANFPNIRLLTVPRRLAPQPTDATACQWLLCNPTNLAKGVWGGFSATAFFFGQHLHQELNVPIGLIHSAWGGTVAEAWTSHEGLQTLSDFTPKPPQSSDPNNPNYDTVLFNGMIAPLLPFAIKGAIWYQGESNADHARQYRPLLAAMIKDWRSRFGVGDFPFYLVQLAAFQPPEALPSGDDWAKLREAQAQTVQTVPHTGLAVAIDIGEAHDIHPKNKQEVGHRLALVVLARTYGKKLEFSGPQFRDLTISSNRIKLNFDHAAGLYAKDGPLHGFTIAAVDGKFVEAEATIKGTTVWVSAPQIAQPVAVRYGWENNPACNLFNRAGLPAVPFRTDEDRPMLTQNHK